MKKGLFDELMASVREAREHASGRRSLKTTVLPLPPKRLGPTAVKRLRNRFRASQAVFASYLNVSTRLVQAWEAGRRRPDGPALVLLHLAALRPDLLEEVRRQAALEGRRNAADDRPARRRRAGAREDSGA